MTSKKVFGININTYEMYAYISEIYPKISKIHINMFKTNLNVPKYEETLLICYRNLRKAIPISK